MGLSWAGLWVGTNLLVPPLPGLVQRCVIIQKDQHGFGFTVSGDRVVLVQSVRPGKC